MPSGSRSSCRTLGASAFLVFALAAQGVAQDVVPAGLTTVEGTSGNPFLFGRSLPVRIMDVYNRSELPASFDVPRQIQALVFRADARNNTTLYPKKRNILMTLNVSTSLEKAENTLLEYAAFHGADRTSVFDGRLDVPLQPKPATPVEPRPMNVVLPFTTPWFYTLSPHRGGPQAPGTLVLDYQVHDKVTSTDYLLDMAGFCSGNPTTFGNSGNCLSSVGKKLDLQVGTRTYANSTLAYTVDGAIPKNTVTLLLRFGPRSFPGIPLDQARQCWVDLLPMIRQGMPSDKTGRASFRYPIPRIGGIRGIPIHAQAFGYDINANSAEHVASLGVSTTICGPYEVCQLMQLNGQASRAPRAQSNVYGLAHVVGFR